MTAKEYLLQAHHLDQRIKCKIEQVASLNDLARKATATISDMPGNPNKGVSAMANAVEKIVDLQAEINRDIDRLVDMKMEIEKAVRQLGNIDEQLLLRCRYINNMNWDDIAAELSVSYRTVHRIHASALKNFIVPK